MRASALVQPSCSISIDAAIEALEELPLHAPEARAPGDDQLLNFNCGRLER
jgi:hypothetical protein